MIINALQRHALDKAIQMASNDLELNIYTICDSFFNRDKPAYYGVNWSAFGTVNTTDARIYADAIAKAANIADALNKCEIITDWVDMTQTEDRDWFIAMSENIMKALIDCSPRLIEKALNAMNEMEKEA